MVIRDRPAGPAATAKDLSGSTQRQNCFFCVQIAQPNLWPAVKSAPELQQHTNTSHATRVSYLI